MKSLWILLMGFGLLSACGDDLGIRPQKAEPKPRQEPDGVEQVENEKEDPKKDSSELEDVTPSPDSFEQPIERVFVHPLETEEPQHGHVMEELPTWPPQSSENYFEELESFWNQLGSRLESNNLDEELRSRILQARTEARRQLVFYYSRFYEASLNEVELELESLGLEFVGDEPSEDAVRALYPLLFLRLEKKEFSPEDMKAIEDQIDRYQELVESSKKKASFVVFAGLPMNRSKLEKFLEFRSLMEQEASHRVSETWSRQCLNRIQAMENVDSQDAEIISKLNANPSDLFDALSRLERDYRLNLPVAERRTTPWLDRDALRQSIEKRSLSSEP